MPTTTPHGLSGAASKVLIAMQIMSQQHKEAHVSYTLSQIQSASGLSHVTAGHALRELTARQITVVRKPCKRNGVYEYSLVAPRDEGENKLFTSEKKDIPSEKKLFTPLIIKLNNKNHSSNQDDDDENLIFSRICSVLSEWNIITPFKEQLANALLPLILREPSKLDDVKAICARTKSERVWNSPEGVMNRRLRAFVKGLPDPLPVFEAASSLPVAQPRKTEVRYVPVD